MSGQPEQGAPAPTAGADDPARTVLLAEPPRLGELYRQAARDAGRARVAGLLASRGGNLRRRPDRHREGPAPTPSTDPATPALPTVAYRVSGLRPETGRLTAYQHLLGEPATDLLPAGFVHVLAFPVASALMLRKDFPLRLLGMVHLANRVTQHRALTAGEPLDIRAWARELRAHHRGTRVDLVTSVCGPDGAEAWRGTSTYLAPGVHLAGVEPIDRPDRPEFTPPLPTGRWHYGTDAGRRYAAVSGDANPIHLSAISARAFGFLRAIAHGMDTAARALADVGAAVGPSFTWSAEFAAPVLLPSEPAVRVTRTPANRAGWEFQVWDERHRKLHLRGRVEPR